MRGWVERSGSLVGAAALAVGLVGCAAQHDDSLRLSEELGRARADAAWQQTRAAELEARLARLEQRASAPSGGLNADEHALFLHLDRLLEMNERLLAERVATPASAPVSAAAPSKAPAPITTVPAAATAKTTSAEAPILSDEQQLRVLVERLRGHAGSPHGGLTREQENALRVLTRPERTLDAENPWATAIY